MTRIEMAALAAQLEMALPKGAAAIAPGNLSSDASAFIEALKTGELLVVATTLRNLLNDLLGVQGPQIAVNKLGAVSWGSFLQLLIQVTQQLLPLLLVPAPVAA